MGYRTTFVLSLFRVFLLPPLVTALGLLAVPSNEHPLPPAVLILLSVPVYIAYQSIRTSFEQARAARRLGALPIPVVRGKWPGNVDVLKRLLHGWRNGYINETLREVFEEYQTPTINLRILWVDQIWTMDPNHMKHILVSGFQHFDKGAPQRQRMKGFLGTGIFAADGEMWKMHRSMARPFLSKSRTSDIALFSRHADDAFAQLDKLAAAAGTGPVLSTECALDVQDLCQRYTLDVAIDSFFGIGDIGTLRDPIGLDAEKEKAAHVDDHEAETGGAEKDVATDRRAMMAFAHAMDKAADTTILRARQGVVWPLIEFRTDKQKEPARIMRRWLDAVIKKTKPQVRNNEKREAETFLEHLVQISDDDTVIRDQLINMVLGARDTTAALLTFVFYFLALHPDVYAKLRTEVLELCPLGEGMPEEARIREFVYLRAILNETLRIFPSVPINTRYSTTESAFPPAAYTSPSSTSPPPYYTKPLYMPPETSISLLPLLMQRRVDLWGADAEEFKPARWLSGEGVNEAGGEGGKRPEWFVPFSAGPRLCPGQNFAYSEATYLIIGLVQRGYVFTLAPACQPSATRPPDSWKADSPAPPLSGKADRANVFTGGKGRQAKEQCWPGAAFTLFSRGGLWMYVSKIKDSE